MDDAPKQREADERERRGELDRAEDPDASRYHLSQSGDEVYIFIAPDSTSDSQSAGR